MHPLLQLVLCVCKGAVAASGAAALLPEVSAHAGLVLAVGLWLQQTHPPRWYTHPLKRALNRFMVEGGQVQVWFIWSLVYLNCKHKTHCQVRLDCLQCAFEKTW